MKHQVVDQRSLELNKLIANKIQKNPDLVKRGLDNIDRYVSRPTSSYSGRMAMLEWKEIIENNTFDRILDILTEDSDEGQRLRQSSPFTGIITEEERMEIFRKYEPFRV